MDTDRQIKRAIDRETIRSRVAEEQQRHPKGPDRVLSAGYQRHRCPNNAEVGLPHWLHVDVHHSGSPSAMVFKVVQTSQRHRTTHWTIWQYHLPLGVPVVREAPKSGVTYAPSWPSIPPFARSRGTIPRKSAPYSYPRSFTQLSSHLSNLLHPV